MTGDEFRKVRKQMGITQVLMAEKIGVTSTAVAMWERGERKISEPIARLVRLLAGEAKRGRR